MLNFSLPDDWLADAADVRLSCHRGDIHGDLESDFSPSVDLGSDVNIDADVQVLKLRVHQRIDTDSADAGLERTRRNRDAITNLQ